MLLLLSGQPPSSEDNASKRIELSKDTWLLQKPGYYDFGFRAGPVSSDRTPQPELSLNFYNKPYFDLSFTRNSPADGSIAEDRTTAPEFSDPSIFLKTYFDFSFAQNLSADGSVPEDRTAAPEFSDPGIFQKKSYFDFGFSQSLPSAPVAGRIIAPELPSQDILQKKVYFDFGFTQNLPSDNSLSGGSKISLPENLAFKIHPDFGFTRGPTPQNYSPDLSGRVEFPTDLSGYIKKPLPDYTVIKTPTPADYNPDLSGRVEFPADLSKYEIKKPLTDYTFIKTPTPPDYVPDLSGRVEFPVDLSGYIKKPLPDYTIIKSPTPADYNPDLSGRIEFPEDLRNYIPKPLPDYTVIKTPTPSDYNPDFSERIEFPEDISSYIKKPLPDYTIINTPPVPNYNPDLSERIEYPEDLTYYIKTPLFDYTVINIPLRPSPPAPPPPNILSGGGGGGGVAVSAFGSTADAGPIYGSFIQGYELKFTDDIEEGTSEPVTWAGVFKAKNPPTEKVFKFQTKSYDGKKSNAKPVSLNQIVSQGMQPEPSTIPPADIDFQKFSANVDLVRKTAGIGAAGIAGALFAKGFNIAAIKAGLLSLRMLKPELSDFCDKISRYLNENPRRG